MKTNSTTVKLDGHMIRELNSVKRKDQTLTALVREMLHTELRRRRMEDATAKYLDFVRENPDESGDLDVWASAPLSHDPESARKMKK